MIEHKEIKLTRGQVTLVSPEDFDELSRKRWHAIYKPHSRKYYAAQSSLRVNGKKKLLKMHRVIMRAPEGMQVDHINGNSLDNRRCNLRLATPSENQRNRGLTTRNTSGYKGVSKNGISWRAQIKVDGNTVNLGSYTSPEEAHAAYCEAAKKLHGEFWRAA